MTSTSLTLTDLLRAVEPLTEAQRALASDPQAISIAKAAARAVFARQHIPSIYHDEVLSAAMWGLCCAAREWDGSGLFLRFAAYLIPLRMQSVLRDVTGHRRRGPRICPLSLSNEAVEGADGGWGISDGSLPVGWEAESEDEVDSLVQCADPVKRRRIKAIYMEAGGLAVIARRERVSVAAIARSLVLAKKAIRQRASA
jgi:hypothetical protein